MLLIVILPSVCALENYYDVNLKYENSTLSMDRLTIEQTEQSLPDKVEYGDHGFVVLDNQEKLLYANFFYVNEQVTIEYLDNSGNLIGTEQNITHNTINLRIPYYENAKEIVFFTPNDTLFSYDLSKFSTVRSENVTFKENNISGIKTMIKQPLAGEKEQVSKNNIGLITISIVAIIALIALIFFWIKKRKK